MSGPERALIRFAGTAAVVCLAACRREAERPVPPAVPSAAAQAVAQAASSAVVSAAASAAASEAAAQAAELAARPAPGAAWPALVRDEQWDEAWRVLRALPAEEAARPEVRYVSARVALARGDAAAALPLLQDIEGTLPLLADDVLRRRAEAKLAVGPFEEAGDWYSARQTAAAQLDAAKAFERAKDPRRARAAVERVFAADKRTRAQEAEARSMRIRLAESIGDTERADARWLAIEGADAPAAADALALLAKVDPKHPLHTDELFARAQVLSDAGHTDEALHALDAIAAAPGAAVPPLKRLRARGNTLFKAHGRGSEAAKVLSECAVQGGPDAAEDAFHAARALSRADRDEEAIRGYQDVIKRWPKSSWGVHAAYFIPYLKMLHAEWTECARAFDTFVRKRPEAEEVRDAQRFGALCELMAGGATPSPARAPPTSPRWPRCTTATARTRSRGGPTSRARTRCRGRPSSRGRGCSRPGPRCRRPSTAAKPRMRPRSRR
jgi:tetratricopeptide (TPR) repeat protein